MRLRNYFEHPSQRNYIVFQFYNLEMAEAFEAALTESKVDYERDDEDTVPKRVLFGVHKTHADLAKEINNIIIGQHRKPFVPNPYLKWTMLIFTAGAITLAILGYLKDAA